jgi:hypothetical protein
MNLKRKTSIPIIKAIKFQYSRTISCKDDVPIGDIKE